MKSLNKIFLLLVFCISFTLLSHAQSDSLILDTVQKKWIRGPKDWTNPEKAGIMSAVIPGLGQAYNKKYWKIPLIYLVGGYLVASTIHHHQEYKILRNGLTDNVWSDDTVYRHPITMDGGTFFLNDPYTIELENQYRTARDNERQKRDRFIVVSTLFYALNIVDAIVDAHLSEFDLGDDLSMKINPDFYSVNNKFAAGISLGFNFK